MFEHLQPETCPKCVHYKTCEKPCFPVWEYLNQENLSVYEQHYTNEEGERVDIVFARSRETPETDLAESQSQTVFNTCNESPFSDFVPRLKQTGIFLDRFFHQFSYKDLAVKYGMSEDNCIKSYHNAVNRVLAVLEHMDKANAVGNFDFWKEKVEERSGSLPKGQKWFLLNKLFGLRPSQIAEMEGIKGSSSVRQLIIRVSDQLRCGEIRLFDATPEEVEEAKARLDTHNAKRRERHAKKKALPA
jgi:hypothetical protein